MPRMAPKPPGADPAPTRGVTARKDIVVDAVARPRKEVVTTRGRRAKSLRTGPRIFATMLALSGQRFSTSALTLPRQGGPRMTTGSRSRGRWTSMAVLFGFTVALVVLDPG